MAEKTVFTEKVGNITETFGYDDVDQRVTVRRTEDVQPIIDAVAKANLNGTTEIPGLGRLVAEVPITLAMQFCEHRGIAWEQFMYGSDHDAEFRRFIAEHKRIAYTHSRNSFAGADFSTS